MKRLTVLMIVVLAALMFAGCTQVWDFITGFIPEAYDDLVGSWTVIDRPDGWSERRYHFNEDRTFDLDYDNLYWTDQYTQDVILSAYGGEIVSVNDEEFTVRVDHYLVDGTPARQTWVYRWPGTEKNTMQLGLIDDETGVAEYYWELIRD